jgi:Protein of unknwon function (DUF3008)
MPAVSGAQQRFMAMVEHDPSKLQGKMPSMTHQQLHDFAATPRKGLPTHVKPPTAGLRSAARVRSGGMY